MTSFADRNARLGRVLVLAWGLGIAAAALASAAPGPVFEEAARQAIARRLGRPAAEVRLLWNPANAAGDGGDSLIDITGGEGGWFSAISARGRDRVARRVQALVRAEALLAARPLAAGSLLTADDLRRDSLWIAAGPAACGPAPEAGWEVRRAIAAGGRLRWPAVAPPAVIAPGQRVVATWESGDVRVRLAGVALQGARAGRPVRVRLEGLGRTRSAVATAPGEVRMDGEVVR